jgi:long-chain acyl-CoA synthetase
MFKEYWRNPQQTATALVDGWFRSGDLGYIDAAGYVFVVDRLKDMIITGGENVYSAEVEDVIRSLPGVAQVAVIGIPSAAWGEQVHAIVVPEANVVLDVAVINAGVRQRLGGYKCPKSIEIRTEPLPVTGTNKLNKRALREPHWQTERQ